MNNKKMQQTLDTRREEEWEYFSFISINVQLARWYVRLEECRARRQVVLFVSMSHQ